MNCRAAFTFATTMLCGGCAAESPDELLAEAQRLAPVSKRRGRRSSRSGSNAGRTEDICSPAGLT